MGTFTARVKGFSEKALRNIDLVVKQSIQDIGDDAQKPRAKGGRMRVDTGFLRNSLEVVINGSVISVGAESYILSLATLKMGDVYIMRWTAPYAVHREFGANGQAPDFFARGAAQKVVGFVYSNAAKLKD